MSSRRLEAFSDGVFAVAITLLVFNLTVPGPGHGALSHLLAERWPAFAGYGVSFLTIGIIWVNHHALVDNFTEIDRPLLFFNLLLLFFVVTIPFATSTMASYLRSDNADAALAAVIFQSVFLGMSVSFGIIFAWALKHGHLRVRLSPDDARKATIRFVGGNVGYAVAIGVAFVSAPAALAISAALAVYYMFEQTPAREPAASTDSEEERGD